MQLKQKYKKILTIIIPRQIIRELKKIMDSSKKLHFKKDAEIALKILEKNSFKKIDLIGKTVDKGIINFAKKDKKIIIATLDKELKKAIEKAQKHPPKPKIEEAVIFNKKKPGKKTRKKR